MSVLGDALAPVALAFAMLDELYGTPARLGFVLAAQTLPMAALILAAGVWADRLNRRNVMLVSDAGRAAVQATLATLLITGAAELWHVIALVVCVLALGPVIADRDLDGASSWAAISTCFGIGTIAGSVLVLRVRPRHPMYGATLAFVLAACQALAAVDVRRLTAP